MNFKPGDLIVTYGKGWFGKYVDHIALVVSVYGRPIIYESTMADRPLCVRTGRESPKGVQAHYIEDVVNLGGASYMPLICPLYADEEDRLLAVAESCLGRGFEFIGGETSSAFVARVLAEVGIVQQPNASKFRPQQLVNDMVAQGFYRKPVAIA
jgi:hypothetical protein